MAKCDIKSHFKRRIWVNHVLRYGGKCAYCQMSMCWGIEDSDQCATLDHILAYSMGGMRVTENIAVVCQRCNRLKAQWEMTFLERYRWFFNRRDCANP